MLLWILQNLSILGLSFLVSKELCFWKFLPILLSCIPGHQIYFELGPSNTTPDLHFSNYVFPSRLWPFHFLSSILYGLRHLQCGVVHLVKINKKIRLLRKNPGVKFSPLCTGSRGVTSIWLVYDLNPLKILLISLNNFPTSSKFSSLVMSNVPCGLSQSMTTLSPAPRQDNVWDGVSNSGIILTPLNRANSTNSLISSIL